MKSKIEKYIRDNRAQLDVEEPDEPFIWEGISRQLNKRKRKYTSLMKIAAIMVIAFTAGYIIMNSELEKKKANREITLSDISSELASRESFFQLTINQQLEEIESYGIEKSEYEEFFRELRILDDFQEEYIEDLQEMGNHPRVIKAMLNYYQMKIRILDNLLKEIEKNQNHENKNLQIY